MTYIMFARWFGLVSVFLAFGVLFNLDDARKMAKNLVDSESGYILGGVLPVIFGSLSLVLIDNFEISWKLVPTLVGVSLLLVGIFRVIFVDQWKAFMSKRIDQVPFLFSLFGLMLGVVLLYVGFFASAFEYTVT